MCFMFDTNICIDLIRKKSEKLLRRLKRMRLEDICISSITLSELEYGVCKSAAPEKNKLALTEFMTPIAVVAYGDEAAPHYGRIRTELEARGKTIGPLDMLIAAHALSLGLTVVTNNEREFRRVPNLKVENWTK